MAETRGGAARLAAVAGLLSLAIGLGLGQAGRLTYHEAFVAQAAREMIASGDWLVPTIDGQPWLEKPPLAIWLVALAGRAMGGVDEFVARLPSAVAAFWLAIGVASFATRRFGPDVGLLAGAVQATTFWLVVRGRLAEADILLACLVTWTLVAFDRIRTREPIEEPPTPSTAIRGPHARPSRLVEAARRSDGRMLATSLEREETQPLPRAAEPAPAPMAPPSLLWSWAFFAGLGATSLVKGVGFGAVLVGSVVVAVLIWDRDLRALRALAKPRRWALAAALALAWPALVAIRLPSAVSLWALHVTDRLAAQPEHFIGGPWWQYGPAVLGQALPWTPLALAGAWPSLVRATRGRGGADRLLWAWTLVPVLVLSTATVKNAHYAIHALAPLAIWSALALASIGDRLQQRRGWSPRGLALGMGAGFVGLALACGLGHLTLGPRFDRRGQEWIWTGKVGRSLDPALPLVFLYEDWDRKPYPTPFGPMPHDWAVRLFYLRRPASWRQGVDDLARRPPAPSPAPYALFGRDRDLPELRKLGDVTRLVQGPADRFDRRFTLFRVTPHADH